MSEPEQTASESRRRRVRVAEQRIRRVTSQKSTLAERYAATTTALDRFVVLTNALRAAAAPGGHQVEDSDTALDRINALLTTELDRLHDSQLTAAQRVVDREAARKKRKEARSDDNTRPA